MSEMLRMISCEILISYSGVVLCLNDGCYFFFLVTSYFRVRWTFLSSCTFTCTLKIINIVNYENYNAFSCSFNSNNYVKVGRNFLRQRTVVLTRWPICEKSTYVLSLVTNLHFVIVMTELGQMRRLSYKLGVCIIWTMHLAKLHIQ